MILIKGIDALVLSCCGGCGICLFFLNVIPERLACDSLVYLINSRKIGEKLDTKEISIGICKTVEV